MAASHVNDEGFQSTPSFKKILCANTLLNFADTVGLTAMPLLAAVLTNNAKLVAGVSIVQQVPLLLFTLPMGVWLDRIDRKKLFSMTGLFSFLVILIFATLLILDKRSIWLLYIFAFLVGSAQMMIDSTSPILIRQTVDISSLRFAYSRLTTGRLLGEAAATTITGFLFAAAVTLPFGVQGATVIIAITFVFTLRGNFKPSTRPNSGHFFKDLWQGIHWLQKTSVYRTLTLFSAAHSFFSRLVFSIFVLYVLRVIHVGPQGYGVISVFFTVGGIMAKRCRGVGV